MKDAMKEAHEHIAKADQVLSRWSVSGALVHQMSAVRLELQAALMCTSPAPDAGKDPAGEPDAPDTAKTKGGGKNGG